MGAPRFFHSILLLCLIVGVSMQAAEVSFNTIKVRGKKYVNLADIVSFYEMKSIIQTKSKTIDLSSKAHRLKLKIDSRECSLDGIRIWLNDAPLAYRNSYLISEMDLRKTIDPVIRPWSMEVKPIKTVMIDPGHGGEDNGTRGYRGSSEKLLTLELSKKVEEKLQKAGFKTLLTRKRDQYISLQDRSELANASRADLFVSIHFNSSQPNKSPSGIETYCLTPVGLSSTGSISKRLGLRDFNEEAGNKYDSQNMLLAYCVQEKLVEQIKEAEDRGVKRARFYVIKATELPSILIENGFLSNPTEEKRIQSSAYQNRLADSIVDGIQRYNDIQKSVKRNRESK